MNHFTENNGELNLKKCRGRVFLPVLFLLILMVFIIINISIGTINIPFIDVIKALSGGEVEKKYSRIIFDIRIPRVLMGILCGATLSVAGTLFQALLRNPLADPYILGISSGAAFGTVLSIAAFGTAGVLTPIFYNLPFMAFLFAMISAFSTYFIARKGGKIPVVDLILSGVIMNFLFSAGTTFVIVFGWRNVQHATYWLMGSLSGASWSKVIPMIFVASGGVLTGLMFSNKLNAISLGEEEAINLGVNVEKLKILIFVVGTLLTAYCVTATGIVGFVGLIMPHTARLIFGPNHKISVPMSALLGGIFLSVCDTIARSVFQPTEMPLGTITALVGAPIFVYLLRRGRK